MPKSSRNCVWTLGMRLKCMLAFPYELYKILSGRSKPRQLGVRLGSDNLYFGFTSKICVDVIKTIMKNHGVGYSTVVHSAVNGGIARALKNSGIEPPAHIDYGYVLPVPNHPGGLNIQATQANIHLPCRVQCSKERLYQTQHFLKNAEESNLPLAIYHGASLLALAPIPIVRAMHKRMSNGGLSYMSNLPTTFTKEYADGLEIVDVFVTTSISDDLGLFISCGGINNKQRIMFNMDKSVFGDNATALKFAACIEEELDVLERLPKSITELNCY
ncbi:unnamed protein product [Allacma fusca]|uniref:O-acyltransferase WSD1 C-terminal domain-containing protein n=1 Tax=Allacma fusca TaxID=39272 RepID=A0A8J2Q3T1_9HEXA|nr:unnamed protein product [Allacma fusca]